MTLFRNILFLSSLLISLHAFGKEVCLMESSSHQMFANTSAYEFINHGFKKGMSNILSKNKFKTYKNEQGDVGLVQMTKKAIGDGCKVLFGYATSKECLLVADIIKEKNVLVASSSCVHDKVREYYPHFIVGVASFNSYVDKLLTLIQKQMRKKKALLVYSRQDVLSKRYFSAIKESQNIEGSSFDINEDAIKIANKIKESKNVVLTIMLYPYSGMKLLNRLSELGVNLSKLDIYVAPSWPYDLRSLKKIKDLGIIKHLKTVEMKLKIGDDERIKEILQIDKELDVHNIHITGFEIARHVTLCLKKYGASLTERLKACLFDQSYTGVLYDMIFHSSSFPETTLEISDLKKRL